MHIINMHIYILFLLMVVCNVCILDLYCIAVLCIPYTSAVIMPQLGPVYPEKQLHTPVV